uniref:Receptor ligand binding region domain-containing protein n=1 Tax=Timema shepardi TaxID=629360 RepID=A0A7R9G7A2_TIMSH|nr:unnamed protein product [Timema shepardi]
MEGAARKGSQRRPDDLVYRRPGLTISGAISLAVSEVNKGPLAERGHTLGFLVAETYGEEVTSIRQTAALWTRNVSAYVGPQETCVHEARMAAAFNLPMISYVSTCCRHSLLCSAVIVKNMAAAFKPTHDILREYLLSPLTPL